ncbi:MtrB/PioB family decaheme-associated outer membrane protein [Ramlibacter alkalitolerans]|uniref:MtrB/PioB family decaheme-associated outer membrane protein n=1 Tax=Ramlibacter alkalitolerans TaxID=2039631 RepID=A0ABS1JLC9_9BURK|nr:MtrB/PioB family decaheme-associated outer membrane protein [Ramlibacter alkalitolerans]MBL0425030.1 MtrB/PioB family decaheme-associated outer membrane protein [Ramlibacter alkalitolerans]
MLSLCRPAGRCRPTLLALALLAAFAPAWSHADTVTETSVSAGLGAVDGNRLDRAQFDQYSGLRPSQHVFGLFGLDYYRRNDDTGVAVRFGASDLLTDNRELGLHWARQGDWVFSADYKELVRRETVIFNSGITGVGSAAPVLLPVTPGTGSDLDLRTRREGVGLGFRKVISPSLQFELSGRTEHKTGSRLFGVGFACPSALAITCTGTNGIQTGSGVLFVPEPIDSDHNQVDARLSFAAEKLRLSFGYYGSFYQNSLGSLHPQIPGSLFNPTGTLLPVSSGLAGILGNPVALPPDNQAHQLDITGAYLYNARSTVNFKLSRTRATQNANFLAEGLSGAPAGVSDLGGRVDTTLAQVGFSTRPLAKLSVQGTLRYEDRDDKTPLALYNVEGTSFYTNRQLPYRTTKAKLQANYQFTSAWRGTLGFGRELIDRGVFTPTSATAGVTAERQKTAETTYRAELRRQMTEAFSGAVALEHSERSGSNWLRDNSGLGVTEVPDPNAPGIGFDRGIFMPTLADRRRDKVRLLADWQPLDKLSVQGALDVGIDRYQAPGVYGVRDTSMRQATVDFNYAITDAWNVNGFVAHGNQTIDQGRPDQAFLAFRNGETNVGLGLTGKATSKLELGANLSYLQDRATFVQALDTTASAADAALLAASGGLPPITFRQHVLRLSGKYTVDKKSSVRAEFAHYRTRWDDWAWNFNGTPFVFADGTVGTRKLVQHVNVLRVVYTYSWK